jgi:uncharacterized protein YutE (UPF0331/DUF86 family)/predicted nucleotidyltransferase
MIQFGTLTGRGECSILSLMDGISRDKIVAELSSYFCKRTDIAFSVLFGSIVRGNDLPQSDIDVGVYFIPAGGELEIENEVYYDSEDDIWADIDHISGKETDLLVMNRAPSRIVFTALTEGIMLSTADGNLCWRVIHASGSMFEEYYGFTESFAAIKRRSQSLCDTDKERLLRIVDFLETETRDAEQFITLSYSKYIDDSAFRRNIERWIENLVNASVDAAKIIVASQKQTIPQTYRETIYRLKTIPAFPPDLIDSLASNTRLRNIPAHEYLDIRYRHIERFTTAAEKTYLHFIESVRSFLLPAGPQA